MADPGDIKGDELRRRVVYAFLRPVARLARVFGLTLGDLGQLTQMAYFHETRRVAMRTPDAAELLGVSLRKLAQLSRLLKDNFTSPEVAKTLPRRIEFLLWAEPLGRKRIKQLLRRADGRAVDRALDQLIEEGRVVVLPGRTPLHAVRRKENVLVRDDWMSRIDGLENLLSSVVHATYGRFFDGEPNAFARTLTFHIRPRDLPRLDALYEDGVFGLLRRLDAEAEGAPDAVALALSICWAPLDYLDRAEGDDDGDADDAEPGSG